MRRNTFLSTALIFAAGISFTGCTLADDYGHDERATPIGRKATDYMIAGPMQFARGHLIAPLIGVSYSGIAVIDTATDIVKEFYKTGGGGNGVSDWVEVIRDSLVVSVQADGMYTLDLTTRTVKKALTLSSPSFGMPYKIGDRLFLTHSISSNIPNSYSVSEPLAGPTSLEANLSGFPISGIAVAGDRILVGSFLQRRLILLNALSPTGSPRDSLDLGILLGDTTLITEAMATHGERIFLDLVHQDTTGGTDTAFVAVLDANTLAVQKTIPLRYKWLTGQGRIANGIWYLPRRTDFQGLIGGVEAINLETAEYLGTVVNNLAVGVGPKDFIPVSSSRGYISYWVEFPSLEHVWRRISF